MTCKRACHSHTLSVFASVVAVFTFVVGLATPAAVASTPSFLPAVAYGSGGYAASSVVVADVNRDGKPDLVVANFCMLSGAYDVCNITGTGANGVVGVLLGNGDGTFQTAATFDSGGLGATSVAVSDVNGDGKPDLLVANSCNANVCSGGAVGVLLGNGDGTFQPAVAYIGFNTASVAVADVNDDGKPDLLVRVGLSRWGCS